MQNENNKYIVIVLEIATPHKFLDKTQSDHSCEQKDITIACHYCLMATQPAVAQDKVCCLPAARIHTPTHTCTETYTHTHTKPNHETAVLPESQK